MNNLTLASFNLGLEVMMIKNQTFVSLSWVGVDAGVLLKETDIYMF
jgi:hypothetical protein